MLIRTDSGGGTHEFLAWLTRPGRRLHYSVGIHHHRGHAGRHPQGSRTGAWTPAYDADGQVRPGAWVAELTGMLDLAAWPAGMRVIVRKERPHPGAQLRFTDIDGHRFTCFATSTPRAGSSPTWNYATAAGHGARTASAAPKTPGCATCPLHGFAQNQIWCEIVAMACELLAWMAMLALDGPARSWEPKRLRLRLFSAAGRLVRGGRRLRLRIAADLALGHPDHRRDHPACRPSRPADQPQPPLRPERTTTRARGTPPTRRDSRAARHTRALKKAVSRSPRPPSQDHERCRLTQVRIRAVVKQSRPDGPRWRSVRRVRLGRATPAHAESSALVACIFMH